MLERARRGGVLLMAALVACALVACATPQPPRTPAQQAADAATAARVQAALAAQPDLYSKDIVVSVDYGVAYLSGMAWSNSDIETAGRVAGSVSGVKSVNNNIGLESAQVGH